MRYLLLNTAKVVDFDDLPYLKTFYLIIIY